MVILPRDYQIDLLIKQFMPRHKRYMAFMSPKYSRPTKELHRFIAELRAAYQSQPSDLEAKQDLDRLCEVMIMENEIRKNLRQLNEQRAYNVEFPFSDDAMGAIASICLSCNALAKVQSAVAAVKDHIPHEAISEMTNQFHRFSFDQLRGW